MTAPPSPGKGRRGIVRLWHATRYSIAGLHTAWTGEAAFRQEVLAAVVLLPLACWLGSNWVEVALLAGSVLVVLITELLNSAVEAVVDRSGSDWNIHAKRAKDMGSAAVMVSLILAAGVWLAALWQRLA